MADECFSWWAEWRAGWPDLVPNWQADPNRKDFGRQGFLLVVWSERALSEWQIRWDLDRSDDQWKIRLETMSFSGFINKDGRVYYSHNGSLIRCVSCDEPIEHDPVSHDANHHCSDTHERAKSAANTRLGKREISERQVAWCKRFCDGVMMDSLGDDDDGE